MKIFEQERKKILSDCIRSPRCIRQKPDKPNNQFYSWKNGLNPNINNLYDRIRKLEVQKPIHHFQQAQEQYYLVQPKGKLQKRSIMEVDSYAIMGQEIPERYLKDNRNCYSKVQIAWNSPHKHRHSSSTFTNQKKTNKQLTKTAVPSIEIEGLSSRSREPDSPQQESFTDTAETKFLNTYESNQKDHILWDSDKKSFQKYLKNSFSTDGKFSKTQSQLDLYHQQLREQERLYLLEKFMEHYEKIHHFKI